ncbi:MAG: 3-hydroxybutyrate dehydrogenase [Alphaproteobacteria bacterium]|jgi:3-hydroxybutyrate dehydrogenase|nr:3-hydroxybutyrate dehydrogenase [Alphaproteobacteria bacterium]MCB1550378.1 3-hydroxybutyrate dehydrogenase [Alphaproteobacteria bacterium]MCB9985277.1 3-hydroxybutyrate dehydrogenase [Micavibrio sp.]HRK98224.1 3-hydroxybutyrate dehydrogenase [Alphaproteobacteria bacterium]
MFLKGKVALVTGSTSGIGLAIAHELAAQGADVVLNGFGDAAEIEVIRQDIENRFGVRALFAPVDVADYEAMEKAIATVETELGSLDILVNNAGIQHVAPTSEFPIEKWNKVIDINLTGVFYGIRAVLPGMKHRGFGRIINIASAHGLVASANKAAYVAAKHGVVGLTKVVALENARANITCNAICPGWVLTPLVQKQIDDRAAASGRSVEEEADALVSEKQPNARFTTPEEIGALAVYLCSEAARGVTGTAISIDGAWTAQ